LHHLPTGVRPLLAAFDGPPTRQIDVQRAPVRTGRTLGTPAFVADLERRVGRQLASAKRSRKRSRKRRETIGPAIANSEPV